MEPAIGTWKHIFCSVIVLLAVEVCKTINRFTKSLLLITGFLTGCYAHAQEYTYIHYDVKDGLAGSTVYDLCQDKDGFLWFATDAGVCRFDGSQFRRFTTADGLPEIEVVRLFADSKGRVWMSPFKNSICYYYKGKIHNQDNDPVLKRLHLSSVVIDYAECKNGNIAFTTGKNGFVIRSDTLIDALPKSVPFLDVMMLNINPDGPGFQFTTIDSMFTFVDGKITEARKNPFPSPFVQNRHSTLKYPPKLTAHSMMPQRDKLAFVNTYNGSWMVDTTTYDRYQEVFLQDKPVSHSLIDNENNIWFTTLGQGVYKLASREFKTWYFRGNSTPEVTSLDKYNQIICAGSGAGKIYRVAGRHVDTLTYERFFKQTGDYATSSRVVFLRQMPDGALIAGFDAFLVREKDRDRKINFGVSANKGVDMVNDSTILVATGRNLLLLDSKTLAVRDTILHYRSTAACYYNNAYYVGTVNGLYLVSKDKRLHNLGNIHPALGHRISYFAKTADGGLWVATYGAGVVLLKNNTVVKHITTTEGMSSNTCRTLFVREPWLWVGTDMGLNKINTASQPYHITHYTTSDGLPSDIVNAVYVNGDSVYVGSPAGLTLFNQTKIPQYSKCQLQLLDVSVAGQSQPLQDKYQLRHSQNGLKITYAGISFRSGGDILYRYRLKGLTEAWDSTRQTVLEYPSLPPGEYQFQLVAINKKGIMSNLVNVPFIVSAGFWQTLPFQILVIAVAILVTWILVAWRFSIIRKQELEKTALQQRLNDLEQMALRSQMNPHFIFNCLNSIQNFIIRNNLEASNLYLSEFAHLIRQTLDNSEKGSIAISNEIRYLKRYLELEMMRFGHSFNYSIEVDKEINQEMTFIPTMILQPYIENSIRHGIRLKENGIGHIKVKFEKSGDGFVCIIEDNGIGRKKASEFKSHMHVEYQSKGMSLTAERINILNRQLTDPITINIVDLNDNHNQPTGTRIEIRFPGTVHYKPVRNDTNRNY